MVNVMNFNETDSKEDLVAYIISRGVYVSKCTRKDTLISFANYLKLDSEMISNRPYYPPKREMIKIFLAGAVSTPLILIITLTLLS